jgi:hypothetical protein
MTLENLENHDFFVQFVPNPEALLQFMRNHYPEAPPVWYCCSRDCDAHDVAQGGSSSGFISELNQWQIVSLAGIPFSRQ